MPDLETVILPAGLIGIPKDAFANSAKLATVKFGTADTNNGGSGNQRATTPTGEDNAITLPKGITTIDANAFAGTKATTVNLSQVTGLTSISNSVFQNMTSLTEVKLPSSITTINTSAFQNDTALKKLSTNETTSAGRDQTTSTDGTATFGSKLTSIGNNAFYSTGFTTVDLSAATGSTGSGASTQTLSVGPGAFTNMAELTTVKLPKDSNINPAYFGNPANAEGTPKLTSITYGENNEATAAFSGTNNTFSGTNYNKISNQTIDLIGYTNLTTLGAGVLFGNTAMTTLKMNAPIMSLSGANVSVADPV